MFSHPTAGKGVKISIFRFMKFVVLPASIHLAKFEVYTVVYKDILVRFREKKVINKYFPISVISRYDDT